MPISRWFMFFGILIFFMLSGLIPRYLTGDEPHYLLIAQSIVTDLDVDLAGEYAEVPTLSPHRARMDRGFHSIHNVGLSILLAIPWAIGGEQGAIFMMNLVAALLVLSFDRLLETYKITRPFRFAATLSFAACLPTLSLASQIFPEIPGALAITVVLHEFIRSATEQCKIWLVVMCIIILPWLHVRYLPYTVFLVALPRFFPGYQRIRFGLFSCVALFTTLGVQSIVYVKWFGSPWPHAMWGSVTNNLTGQPLEGLLGLFLDQQYGILWIAPVYLLWPVGIFLFVYNRNPIAVPILGLIICSIITAISHM